MGARYVAGSQSTPLQIAELVADKQRMIACAGEVAVISVPFLLAVGRAHALNYMPDLDGEFNVTQNDL
jgi:hypothetical protein